MRLRVQLAAVILGLSSLLACNVPAFASTRADQRSVNWNQHDTAVYVVSTLNLLRTRSGRPVASLWVQKGGVARFDVYADVAQDNLYFIEMKRADQSVAGTLAYQMGWPRPRTLTPSFTKYHIAPAPDRVSQQYQSDTKQLLASFTSTLPQ